MSRKQGTGPCIVHQSWTEQADWMRQVGATKAAWSASGQLLSLELGPRPHDPAQTTQPEDSQEQEPTPVRVRRAAVPGLTGASGGEQR